VYMRDQPYYIGLSVIGQQIPDSVSLL